MIVGVYIGDYSPESGGGYTFVNDVFESFLLISTASKHSFKVVASPKVCKKLNKVTLPSNVSLIKVNQLLLVIDKFFKAIKHWFPWVGILFNLPCFLDRVSLKYDIKVLWFVGGASDTTITPYISTVWDVQHLTHPWFPEVAGKHWNAREIFYQSHLRKAFCVITGTLIGKAELEMFYRLPTNRVAVLPHPTPFLKITDESEEFSNYVLKKYHVDTKYIIYPAQFWAHKNHANLVFAVKELVKRNHKFKLILIGGDQGNKNYIEALVRSNFLEQVILFPGFVPRDDLVVLYKNAQALVYPSFSGPENLPPLEAMSVGCPVAVAEYPGAREQFGDAALYFDPTDVESIQESILKIIDDDYIKKFRLIELGYSRANRWSGKDYVMGVFNIINRFEKYRISWK